MRMMIEARRSRTQVLRAELGDPSRLIAERRWVWRDLRARLQSSEAALRTKKLERVRLAMGVLDSLSPLRVLDRGYAVVRSSQGVALRSSQQVRVGDEVKVRLAVGQLTAQVKATEHEGSGA
jgi:exodeoxyribonuclease VII large subunit